jgi:hypothetical protein
MVKVGEGVTPEADPWSGKGVTPEVREALVRGEYRCPHGSRLWHWYPVGKVPERMDGALGNDHYCKFVLVSTKVEPD